jgi:hemolysin activation/secretion protein
MTRSEVLKAQQKTGGQHKAFLNHLGAAGMVGALMLLAETAQAQQTINPATTVEQQNAQRLQDLATPPKQTGPVVISPEATRGSIVQPGGPSVRLVGVEFTKSDFLTQADLDVILANYVGKQIDFSQIQTLVQDVNDLYTAKGVITASAVLPPQTLDRGILKVQLVEGKLASVAIGGNKKVPDSFVLERVRLTRGEDTVDVPSAATDITSFNQIYNAQLRMSLQPGANFGTTDLVLALTEPKTNQLSFFLDNQGVESTGQYQLGTFFHSYSLLTPDDNLLVFGTIAEGSFSGTLSYDAPILRNGTRLSATYSGSRIKVIDGPTEPLNIEGNSQSFSGTLTYPHFISSKWAVFGVAGASYGVSDSTSNGTPLVDSTTTKYSLGIDVTYSNQNMAFSISPHLTYGVTEDALEPSTRNITLFTGSFNGTYLFNNGVALTANGAWQLTHEKLLPGDMLFQVGGPSTVRGFPSDAASGDTGYFGQFEVHKSIDANIDGLANGIDVYGFIDMGAVYSTFPEEVFLMSAGVGMTYPLNEKVTLELGVGTPLVNAVANQDSATVYARVTAVTF